MQKCWICEYCLPYPKIHSELALINRCLKDAIKKGIWMHGIFVLTVLISIINGYNNAICIIDIYRDEHSKM